MSYPPQPGYGAPGSFPPPGGYGPPPQAKPTNGLAIAALILGIIAAISCGWLGFLGLISIPLGIMGLSRAKKIGGSGKGLAIGGIITGLLGIAMMAAWAGLVWFAADTVDDFDGCFGDESPSGYPCERQGTGDPDPSDVDGIDSDPVDQICNTDRFFEDPDC